MDWLTAFIQRFSISAWPGLFPPLWGFEREKGDEIDDDFSTLIWSFFHRIGEKIAPSVCPDKTSFPAALGTWCWDMAFPPSRRTCPSRRRNWCLRSSSLQLQRTARLPWEHHCLQHISDEGRQWMNIMLEKNWLKTSSVASSWKRETKVNAVLRGA